jgi:hypothetical protein
MLYLLSSRQQNERPGCERKGNERGGEHAESKYFLICKSCFWCATYLNGNKMIINCPACYDDGLLDSIPILDNEVYKIKNGQR